MAENHPSGTTGAEHQPDTDKNAKVWQAGQPGDQRDVLIIPGHGIYLSRSAKHQMEQAAEKDVKGHPDWQTSRWGGGKTEYYQQKLGEAQVLEWADEIRKSYAMAGKPAPGGDNARAAYEAKCYPGTDTFDPLLDPSVIRDKQNGFDLDRSESTVLITCPSGSRWLNASAVKHTNYVSFKLTTPDGRHYGEFSMSFDQFASALVKPMHTPITWDFYWSLEPGNVALREVVKEPDSLMGRAEQRLGDRIDEVTGRLRAAVDELRQHAETGKPMSKTRQAELVKSLDVATAHLKANTTFVLDQAMEEASHIMETAAVWIANSQHLRGVGEIMGSTPLGSLLGGVRPSPHADQTGQLPAPPLKIQSNIVE